MQSLSVFLDITKVHDFRWKNANVSRTHGVCHMIYIFLDLLYVRCNCAKFYHSRICATDFKEAGGGGGTFWLPLSVSSLKRPMLNSTNVNHYIDGIRPWHVFVCWCGKIIVLVEVISIVQGYLCTINEFFYLK